ncbi:hypothetical protein F5148DRAFT_393436 [Russula earlei]|uniref:Uncharacterized protein n=1 Tax=Russula earlei TaxID=71964 RepID=A0ACC0U1J1_9AGAM|nr:hypothetical protein F5148DRAFT_393436 [Russula earlei]
MPHSPPKLVPMTSSPTMLSLPVLRVRPSRRVRHGQRRIGSSAAMFMSFTAAITEYYSRPGVCTDGAYRSCTMHPITNKLPSSLGCVQTTSPRITASINQEYSSGLSPCCATAACGLVAAYVIVIRFRWRHVPLANAVWQRCFQGVRNLVSSCVPEIRCMDTLHPTQRLYRCSEQNCLSKAAHSVGVCERMLTRSKRFDAGHATYAVLTVAR